MTARRYYICKVIGDGQTLATARRPAVADIIDPSTAKAAFNTTSVFATNKGVLTFPWALCISNPLPASAAVADSLVSVSPDIDVLPVASLDALVSSIASATLNTIKNKMTARGINVTAVFAGVTTYRQVIRALGQIHNASFDENLFTV